MKKILAATVTLGLAMVGTAHAAALYEDDFTNITPAPASGGYLTLTGSFDSGSHHYTIGSTDLSQATGNFDVIGPTHGGGLCATSSSNCLDIDGTGAGHNSYFYTDSIAVQANTTYQMTVYVGGNKRDTNPNDKDNFIFGFMNAGTSDAISGAYSEMANFSRDANFDFYTVNYTTGASETSLKLFVQNWTSDPDHPDRALYQGMPNPDDYGPLLQSMTLTAVPLPAAAWLLLSGIGGVAAFARRRRTLPTAA